MKDNQLLAPHVLRNKKYTELDNNLSEMYQNVKKIKPTDSELIYYMKKLEATRAIGSAASAKMYSNIGINTPPIQVFKNRDNIKTERTIIQPDVTQNPNIETILAKDDIEYKKIFLDFSTHYKWELFYDYNKQAQFLKYMTPNCLEELKNIYLIDELRTDIDRTLNNYFLYKTPQSNLYEGVIAIDLGQMQIYNYAPTTRDEFYNFLHSPYASLTPTQKEDCSTYMNRIHMLRELLDDGVLSQNNIETMIKALKHDLPKDIQFLCKKQQLPIGLKNKTYSPIARLWEYNQKELGKDLGL